MKKKLLTLLFFSTSIFASTEECFTSYQNCIDKIISHINSAEKYIYYMASSITSPKIISALDDALKRNVPVSIIVNQTDSKSHQLKKLLDDGADISVDNKHKIHHDKIMIIDEKHVIIDQKHITGNVNFNKNTQIKDSGNIIFFHGDKKRDDPTDIQTIQDYIRNFDNVRSDSDSFISKHPLVDDQTREIDNVINRTFNNRIKK